MPSTRPASEAHSFRRQVFRSSSLSSRPPCSAPEKALFGRRLGHLSLAWLAEDRTFSRHAPRAPLVPKRYEQALLVIVDAVDDAAASFYDITGSSRYREARTVSPSSRPADRYLPRLG